MNLLLCRKEKIMTRIIVLLCFALNCLTPSYTLLGQTNMRLGFHAGTTVSWPADISALDNGFFTVSRAGVAGGLLNTLTVSDRFISSIGVNASLQSFALRQTGIDVFNLDVRFKALQLEIPISIGFTGYLGSLKHREVIGIGLQTNLSLNNKIVLNGDSAFALNAIASSTINRTIYPVLMAGFEIGSRFDNDGGLFFGVNFRYGLQEVYSANLSTTVFGPQRVTYNGTYLGLGLTFYLPRYSYWFKREFIY
jgi:hypothetical protein